MKRPAVAEGVLPQLTCSLQTFVPYHFIYMTQEPPPPQWVRTSSLSKLYNLTQLDTPQSVKLLRTSDQLDTDTSDNTHHPKEIFILAPS
jgi:hypothetical protein